MTPSSRPPRLLIRATNWIGDVVMSLPAVRELRRLLPDWQITLAARERVAGLYLDQGVADEILILGPGSPLRQVPNLRRHGFQRAVLLQNAFEAALMAWLSGIPDRAGYAVDGRSLFLNRRARPRIRELRLHQVYYYLDLLFQTGLSPLNYLTEPEFKPDLRLRPTLAGIQRAQELRGDLDLPSDLPWVGLNPGAAFGPAKRWPARRWSQLADRLSAETGAVVLIFGGSDEIPLAEEIQAWMQSKARIIAGRTDLPCLLAMIEAMDLFITNDSGPMHLAAALDVPQIALFGSTDEVATGPWSERARVIHKHVECSPCLRRECPIDLRCFTRISVDEVSAAAREILQ